MKFSMLSALAACSCAGDEGVLRPTANGRPSQQDFGAIAIDDFVAGDFEDSSAHCGSDLLDWM